MVSVILDTLAEGHSVEKLLAERIPRGPLPNWTAACYHGVRKRVQWPLVRTREETGMSRERQLQYWGLIGGLLITGILMTVFFHRYGVVLTVAGMAVTWIGSRVVKRFFE